MTEATHNVPQAPRLLIVDLFAYMVLTFAIGLAVSVALAGAVLLLSNEARAAGFAEAAVPADMHFRLDHPLEPSLLLLAESTDGETRALPAIVPPPASVDGGQARNASDAAAELAHGRSDTRFYLAIGALLVLAALALFLRRRALLVHGATFVLLSAGLWMQEAQAGPNVQPHAVICGEVE